LNYRLSFVPLDTQGKLPEQYLKHREHLFRKAYFNADVYKKRIRLALEPFFKHLNAVGEQRGQDVHVVVVGLGLGVWKIREDQNQIFLDVLNAVLLETRLPRISDVVLAHFGDFLRGLKRELVSDNGNKIRILYEDHSIADKLEDPKKLLAGCYAWDGNSFPGNEYWQGSQLSFSPKRIDFCFQCLLLGALADSSDPAAACCSCIAELQNPLINPVLQSEASISAY